MARILFILACTLTAILNGTAQRPSFPVWQYTPDDGLPSSEVYFIHQDRQGYMWFATDRGLSRFDGYEFRNYGMNEGLKDLVVFQIVESSSGQLWLNTLSNQIFILENDSIRPYPYNHLLKNRQSPSLRLSSIHLDRDDNLVFALVDGGFFRFHPRENKLEPLHNCSGALVIWDGEDWQDRSLYVGTPNGLFYPTIEEFNSIVARGDSFHICIQTPHQQLMLGAAFQPALPYATYSNSPRFLWTRYGKSAYLIQLYNTFFFVENGRIKWTHFDKTEMDCIFAACDGAIWMGGRSGGGLRRYASPQDIPKDRFLLYLRDYSISHLFEGSRGEIWASTLENGIFCIPPTYIESYDQRSGLPGMYIQDIALRDSAFVYFTTQNSYLGALDIGNETLSSELLPKTTNYHVFWDQEEEKLWISSNEIAYRENGRWKYIPGPYYASKKFSALHSPKGALALSSPFALIIVSAPGKKMLVSNATGDLDFNDRSLCIYQDFSGRIWIGALDGLKWLDGRKLSSPRLSHPGLNVRINAIAELPDSTLVIGTQGKGLLLWKNDRLLSLGKNEGLVSDIIECLHIDQKGQLWAGSRNGLNKIVLGGSRSPAIQSFTTHQGLPSNQINVIATWGNHIWLGTAKGLAHFVDGPQHHGARTAASPPLIQSFLVGQEPRPLSGPFDFRHWQNDIVIQYAALDFLQRGNVTYRYRLGPADKWTQTRSNAVNFPTLPPGKYRFEVQARLSDIWSPSQTLHFSIESPFWQKTWFIAFLVLAFLGFVAGAWRFTLRRIREKNDRERRIRQLERSALQAQMNPHFIFNALNSIQGFIRTGDKQNASHFLAKFARLIRSILQQSRVEKVTLDAELSALREYLDLERMRMDNRFEYRIEMEKEVDPFEITLPPMLIQPFLENAVKHGIGPKNTTGQIDLLLSADGEFLHVTVRDDGVGIEQSLARKSADYIPESSLGMKITRERLRLLNGDKGTSKVEAREIKSPGGETLGTEVRFSIRYES